jgi:hypothetical protein
VTIVSVGLPAREPDFEVETAQRVIKACAQRTGQSG